MGLEVVVVVELLAADKLLQLRWCTEVVERHLAGYELEVFIGHLALYTIGTERLDLASDVDRSVVH